MFQERSATTRSRRSYIRAVTTCAVTLAASVLMATPAAAQVCEGEVLTVCGFVWDDVNGNGIQETGETGIADVKVTLSDGADTLEAYTDSSGFYMLDAPEGTYTLSVSTSDTALGTNAEPSPTGGTSDGSLDSDGIDNGTTSSVTVEVTNVFVKQDFDFGFYTPTSQSLGTGTPGYWKNHPEAWPATITVGGVEYDRDTAIYWLGKVGKDKTTTMFSSLVPAKLNVLIGNRSDCVDDTIVAADAWMEAYGPVGSNVLARSAAWSEGQPLHTILDDYNNGLLCAQHRN